MEDPTVDELRAELALLEEQEAKLSGMRGRLQHQIDFGFETETTRTREREVSTERQELHRRIDSLRELLRQRQGV